MTGANDCLPKSDAEKEMPQSFPAEDLEVEVHTGAASSTENDESPAVCAPSGDDSIRCLARAVVASLISAASHRLTVDHQDSSSNDSDDFLVFDPSVAAALEDSPRYVSFQEFVGPSIYKKPRSGVVDQIYDQLEKVSDGVYWNVEKGLEKVTDVVHQNMQYVAAKSKSISKAARQKTERLQDALPRLSDTPKAISQAASTQSDRMQKSVQDTMDFVKEKAELVRDAADTVYVTVSSKAHTGFDVVKGKADLARGTAQAVSVTLSEKAHAVSGSVSEKAQAVSATVSEKAHSGFDMAKEKARAMRDGNCLHAAQVVDVIRSRSRGGA